MPISEITVLLVASTPNGSKVLEIPRIFAKYARKRQLGIQETSQAIPMAQLTRYLNEVATITVHLNVFEF